MRHIPTGSWPDFATKSDVALVKADIAMLGERLNAVKHELRGEIHSESTRMIRWAVSTGIVAVGVAATVTGVLASVLA